jgi:sulfate adenylyltransferase subunit 1
VHTQSYTTEPALELAINEIGLVRFETTCALVFDTYGQNRQTGSFVLIDPIENVTLAAGMVENATGYDAPPKPVSGPARNALERALATGEKLAVLKTPPDAAQVCQLLVSGHIVMLAPSAIEQEA